MLFSYNSADLWLIKPTGKISLKRVNEFPFDEGQAAAVV
jgi:hypothetical protein